VFKRKVVDNVRVDRRWMIWQRILMYREELIRICDVVSLELHLNRKKREEWYSASNKWKRERLQENRPAAFRSDDPA
jgi:hypothetical protein